MRGRDDSYGAGGGNLSLEVRAAIQEDPKNSTRVLSRIYGLGGKDFYATDATAFFEEALEAAQKGRVDTPFAYHGSTPGRPDTGARPGLPPLKAEAMKPMAQVRRNESTGRLQVELEPLWKMTEKPNRSAPATAPARAAAPSRPCTRSTTRSRATWSSSSRRSARWS